MKLLRYVFAIVMMCALSGLVQAHAFRLGVQDAGPGVDYTGTPLTGLLFGSCSSKSSDGCITIENDTGSLLKSFQLVFSDTIVTGGTCTTSTGPVSFSCSESKVGGNYIFTFSSATGIPFDTKNEMVKTEDHKEKKDKDDKHQKGDEDKDRDTDDISDTFTIRETGVPYTAFAKDPLTLTSTPEPSTIWLMSTGALMLGGFFCYKRRNGLGDQSL